MDYLLMALSCAGLVELTIALQGSEFLNAMLSCPERGISQNVSPCLLRFFSTYFSGFWVRVSLHSPTWPGIHREDHAGLELWGDPSGL